MKWPWKIKKSSCGNCGDNNNDDGDSGDDDGDDDDNNNTDVDAYLYW